MDPLATLGYRPRFDFSLTKLRIGAIEFDRDEDFFAVGGDLKEIQVFPFKQDDLDSSTLEEEIGPLQSFSTSGRITGLSWSTHSRGQLCASDSSGIVSIWDAASGSELVSLNEYGGRAAYSVDYSHTQPGVLASAGHDGTVRLWDVRDPTSSKSVIRSSATICAVRFNLTKDYELTFGNSNSVVSLSIRIGDTMMTHSPQALVYDTRKIDKELHVLAEHKGAICGISYHKHNQLFTQSVDGTIKLWDFATPEKAIRTYSG